MAACNRFNRRSVTTFGWLPLLLALCVQLICLINLSVNANRVYSSQGFQVYNAETHHTNRFREMIADRNKPKVVVRRGQEFFFGVRMAENFNQQASRLHIRMMFGYRPNQQDGSLVNLPVSFQARANNATWHAYVYSVEGSKVDMRIWIPANAPVGLWRMSLVLSELNSQPQERIIPMEFYVLFNAWSPTDLVYLPSESDRQEYVMNEFGIIFTGSRENVEYREWYYDQFKTNSLLATLYVLDRSGLTPTQRADPVQVSRMLSQVANSNDENGIVYGKWTEPYTPYVAPWDWLGSGTILEKYLLSNGVPVRYGQCWVFAGITTSMARSLGIPARTITNFASAHDTDNSLTVDRFFNENGDEVKGINQDSVWNFHVWSEVWMARQDLHRSLRGHAWQAIDGTPQEMSGRIYRMGPGNVASTKIGGVNMPYDLPFLYSEVNADVITWVFDRNFGRWRKFSVVTDGIGSLIVTKRKGTSLDFTPDDLTLTYKFREGSAEERNSIQNAGRHMGIPYVYDPSISLRKNTGDVGFRFLHSNKQNFGADLQVVYQVFNKVSRPQKLDLKVNLRSVYYSGREGEVLQKLSELIQLESKQVRNFTITVPPADYVSKSRELSLFKVTAFGDVQNENQTFVEESTISLVKPKLQVQLSEPQRVNHTVTISVSMPNPLKNQPLTECRLIGKETDVSQKIEEQIPNIPAGSQLQHSLTTTAKSTGGGILVIQLDCKELYDTRGHVAYHVTV